MKTSRTVVLISLLAFGAPVMTGCGDSSTSDATASADSAPASQEPFLPTATPTAPVTMADPPADYSMVQGEGFSLGSPSGYQQQRLTSSNGEPMLVLEKPSSVAAVPFRVAVVRDVDPEQSAAEQSFALETAKAAGGPEAEVERSEVAVKGAPAAFLTIWKEQRPSAGTDNVSVTYWQLMVQASDTLILNVVAIAPTDEFDSSEVSTILRSFRLGDDA